MNAPSQSLAHVKELEDRYVMSTFARNNVEFVQGSGMKLTDSTGKTYLDFLAGIAVCSLGHNHPVLTKTLQEQAGNLLHVSNYFYVEHRAEVAELINKLANERAGGAERADESASGEEIAWKTFFRQFLRRGQRMRRSSPAFARNAQAKAPTPSSASGEASTDARLKRLPQPCRTASRMTSSPCPAAFSPAARTTKTSSSASSPNTARTFARSCSSPFRAKAACIP